LDLLVVLIFWSISGKRWFGAGFRRQQAVVVKGGDNECVRLGHVVGQPCLNDSLGKLLKDRVRPLPRLVLAIGHPWRFGVNGGATNALYFRRDAEDEEGKDFLCAL
jgi:hypothetical protein